MPVDMLTALIVPALVGVGIGILSGLLGIGGGTIMVPLFRLLFGMSPLMSTATSLFAIIPTSISGAIAHVRNKTCIPLLGVACGLGGACTSPLGVWLAHISPAWMVMTAAALVICYSAITMLLKAAKMKPVKEKSSVPSVSESGQEVLGDAGTDVSHVADSLATAQQDVPAQKPTRRQLLIGVIIGLGAGVASGYVGLGGGFIMVPLMLSLLGLTMKQVSGTSLIAVTLLAIPGAIEQGILGNINYAAGIAVAIGSIPGALIGAKLIHFVPERLLRFIFGGFLIVAAILLVLNEFNIIG